MGSHLPYACAFCDDVFTFYAAINCRFVKYNTPRNIEEGRKIPERQSNS